MGYKGRVITIMDEVSTAANANSSSLVIDNVSIVGVQIFLDNTNASGSLYFQSTIDETNWVNETLLDGSTSITVSSGTNESSVTHLQLGSHKLRVRWEGSGTGTILATACCKE